MLERERELGRQVMELVLWGCDGGGCGGGVGCAAGEREKERRGQEEEGEENFRASARFDDFFWFRLEIAACFDDSFFCQAPVLDVSRMLDFDS